MVKEFLLYFFTQSAHANTRGTWTTPESASIDRRSGAISFSAAGVNNVPLCIKWMLCFEEPETRTLWLGKAVPRDWLVPTEAPLSAQGLTTRYGRVSFTMAATAGGVGAEGATAAKSEQAAVPYKVRINVTAPASFVAGQRVPAGGLRVRVRAPVEHAGKLSSVTVGGKVWRQFDAAAETIDFSAAALTPALVSTGLPAIVATFGAAVATPLSRASVNLSRRVIPAPEQLVAGATEPVPSSTSPVITGNRSAPACPSGTTQVESFEINSTEWAACEDLQVAGGALVLVSSAGRAEWFPKGYAPYGTNWTDDSLYYLGLGRSRTG